MVGLASALSKSLYVNLLSIEQIDNALKHLHSYENVTL